MKDSDLIIDPKIVLWLIPLIFDFKNTSQEARGNYDRGQTGAYEGEIVGISLVLMVQHIKGQAQLSHITRSEGNSNWAVAVQQNFRTAYLVRMNYHCSRKAFHHIQCIHGHEALRHDLAILMLAMP